MSIVKILENIYWVGKVDNRKVPFHRLTLERGTTYNSYLLKTKLPTVIDTVDIEFSREYVENLMKVINPEELSYIVINHVEPDHSGALPALAARAKNASIVTTELGALLLKDMFKLHNRKFIVVRDGDELDIGGKTLKFYETPYLHTEETMITYGVEDKILFTCDIFSTHIANNELFNDLAEGGYVEDFKVYYKLIMSPHRLKVRDMLEKIKKLDIKMIAPSHGYILRHNPHEFIKMYDELSDIKGKEENKKVVIVYSTMTGNTAKLAGKLEEGLKGAGVETIVFDLKNADLDKVREKIAEADGVLIGSSTRYADMVGNTEDLMKSLVTEGVSDKFGAAFGSFGWSGEGIMHIENYLRKAGFTIIDNRFILGRSGVDTQVFPLRVKFAQEEGMKLAEKAGRIFGEQILTHDKL